MLSAVAIELACAAGTDNLRMLGASGDAGSWADIVLQTSSAAMVLKLRQWKRRMGDHLERV
jgi:hypothetical protein